VHAVNSRKGRVFLFTRSSQNESNPWLVLFSVGLGLFMVVIDVSILNIALPTIAGDLHASLPEIEWTLIAYTLALTGLVPFFGRISDVLGRKKLFIIGVLIFGAASLLAAFAQFIGWLIAARLVQAFGGALITSNVLAIIVDTFPVGKRGTAMGVQAILISGGAAIGPTLGGFLVTNFGWPAVFFVNVPISIAAAIIAAIVLPPLQTHRTMERVDWLGAGLLVAALGSLLLGITKAPDWSWVSLRVDVLIAVGAVLVGLFIRRELAIAHPLVDLSLFRIRQFAAGQAAGVFATIAFATMMLLFPFYWQGLRGYSAQSAGVFMLPLPTALMLSAPISGRLSDRLGSRGIASAGLGVVMLALFLISRISANMPVWDVVWRLCVLGIGLGMFMAPNNNSVMSSAPPNRRGIASGLMGMFRYTGQSLGIAFSGTVFAHFAIAEGFALHGLPSAGSMSEVASNPAALHAFQAAFVNGMSTTALAAMPLAGVAIILSLIRGGKAWSEDQTDAKPRSTPPLSGDY
jgi:EmrB/QacA subfamily drug resistance transporter